MLVSEAEFLTFAIEKSSPDETLISQVHVDRNGDHDSPFAVKVEERERSAASKLESSMIPREYTIMVLDHSLHSKHKLATVAKISNSPDGQRGKSTNESQKGVELIVLLKTEQDGESRSDGRSVILTFSPCPVEPQLGMRPFLSSRHP